MTCGKCMGNTSCWCLEHIQQAQQDGSSVVYMSHLSILLVIDIQCLPSLENLGLSLQWESLLQRMGDTGRPHCYSFLHTCSSFNHQPYWIVLPRWRLMGETFLILQIWYAYDSAYASKFENIKEWLAELYTVGLLLGYFSEPDKPLFVTKITIILLLKFLTEELGCKRDVII